MAVIEVSQTGAVARVRLQRPEVHNAFNPEMIAALRVAFKDIDEASDVRLAILSGEGKSFCGGADINWMRASLDLDYQANLKDAEEMSGMFRRIDRCSKPVIAQIQGAALGGGSGLAACCDIVVAGEEAVFGFTETRLGILPAVISPFVLAKIGAGNARRYFFTGERFDARRAQAIGLVHDIVESAGLQARVEAIAADLLSAGPTAVMRSKQLIREVLATAYDDTLTLTAEVIAVQRTSPEGQEGLRAFLERRKPSWAL